jgi:hypothetical protein
MRGVARCPFLHSTSAIVVMRDDGRHSVTDLAGADMRGLTASRSPFNLKAMSKSNHTFTDRGNNPGILRGFCGVDSLKDHFDFWST